MFQFPNPSDLRSRVVLIPALILHLLLAGGAVAQAPGATEPSLPLWQVSHAGNTVYLMGSVHLLTADAYPLDAALYEAFDASEVVVLELDPDEMMASASMMMMRGMYSDGRTLRDDLPPASFQEVARRTEELGIPGVALQMMKPWLVALTMPSIVLQRSGYSPDLGIDMHFFQRARQSGKTVIALETTADQIDVFDGLSREGQVEYLLSTMHDLDKTSDMVAQLTRLWRTGDADRMAEMLSESLQEHPELTDRILIRRNHNWLPEIESLLKERRPSIVIVGMAHIVGEHSLVELLRGRGYEVTRVTELAAR
jgi:uncharacterized protein